MHPLEKKFSIKTYSHIEEIIADILATALLGPAYPIAFFGSYLLKSYPISTHPPEIIRVYLTLKYVEETLNITNNTISSILYRTKDYIENKISEENHYIKTYYSIVNSEKFQKLLMEKIAKALIEEQYNEEDFEQSYEIYKILEQSNSQKLRKLERQMYDQVFTPLHLISAIWIKRIMEPRLTREENSFEIYIFRHTLHILNSLRAWLEGFIKIVT